MFKVRLKLREPLKRHRNHFVSYEKKRTCVCGSLKGTHGYIVIKRSRRGTKVRKVPHQSVSNQMGQGKSINHWGLPLTLGLITAAESGLSIVSFLPPTHPNIDSMVFPLLGGKHRDFCTWRVSRYTFSLLRFNIEEGEEQDSIKIVSSGLLHSSPNHISLVPWAIGVLFPFPHLLHSPLRVLVIVQVKEHHKTIGSLVLVKNSKKN